MQLPDVRTTILQRKLDSETLIRLLRAGLTPADIGQLVGLSRERVAQIARQSGIDTRAQRARACSLEMLAPSLAREFIEELVSDDGRRRPRSPLELTLGSGARCRWRCRECDMVWEATVANRAVHGSGCPACGIRRVRDIALRERATTPPIAVLRPDLVTEFIENQDVPHRTAETTPCSAHDRVLWRCRSGHQWVTEARQRAQSRTNCPTCSVGLRSSRLEYQVAELLSAMSGLVVHVSHEMRRADRNGVERIDLWIEELALLIDLDPARWHRSVSATLRDSRKLVRLAGLRYVRVRSSTLELLPVPTADVVVAEQVIACGPDDDPMSWVAALLPVLRHLGGDAVTMRELDEGAAGAALARAARRWRQLHHGPRSRSLLSEHPGIASELVEVCGRPGLTAADIAPSGDDRGRWRCRDCGHEWTARVANRTVGGTGCPPCRYRGGGRAWARPRPGRSFADLHPELVGSFLRNLTHPGSGPDELKPSSTDRCLWRCPHCGCPWEASPHTRHRRPRGGCRRCRGLAVSAARRARTERQPSTDLGDR